MLTLGENSIQNSLKIHKNMAHSQKDLHIIRETIAYSANICNIRTPDSKDTEDKKEKYQKLRRAGQ